jgi:hypothetical protein
MLLPLISKFLWYMIFSIIIRSVYIHVLDSVDMMSLWFVVIIPLSWSQVPFRERSWCLCSVKTATCIYIAMIVD